MRGNGLINIIGHNLRSVNPHLASQKKLNKTRICWKCQKDKFVFGGTIKMMGGNVPGALARFICQDCVEAKQAQLKEQK